MSRTTIDMSKRRWTRVVPAAGAMLVIAAVWIACGGPPFNNYDPPPTFAIHYTNQTGYFVPVNGSHIIGTFDPNVGVTSGYVTSGNKREFADWISFNQYYIVQDGRWPGKWDLVADMGCGAGTGGSIYVTSKIYELACVPRVAQLYVDPGSYAGATPPGSLTLTVPDAPPGTSMHVGIVRDDGYVEMETDTAVDGANSAVIPAPALNDGSYYVEAYFTSPVDGLDGAAGYLDIYGSDLGNPCYGDDNCATGWCNPNYWRDRGEDPDWPPDMEMPMGWCDARAPLPLASMAGASHAGRSFKSPINLRSTPLDVVRALKETFGLHFAKIQNTGKLKRQSGPTPRAGPSSDRGPARVTSREGDPWQTSHGRGARRAGSWGSNSAFEAASPGRRSRKTSSRCSCRPGRLASSTALRVP